MSVDDVVLRLAQLRAATAGLLAWLEQRQLTENELREPSLLPGWTRAHVLAHIALNADGIAHTLSGLLRGETVQRYPGGPNARDEAIDAEALRPGAEISADVRESSERLDRVLAAVAEADAWDWASVEDRLAGEWLVRRWREVEIHRVDLAAGYSPQDWPAAFVDYLLGAAAEGLGERTDLAVHVQATDTDVEFTAGDGQPTRVLAPSWAVAAWLIGRSDGIADVSSAPSLRPWI